jgi:tetratricopeptide (TPR) repeat protein
MAAFEYPLEHAESDPEQLRGRPLHVVTPVVGRRDLGIAVLLGLATAGVFAPALQAGFVLYDDPEYLTDNPIVRAGLSVDGVRWAFTTFHAANWHPFTWLSHMLDATLYGQVAWGHHLTSVLLHAVTTALCFLVFSGWTGAPGRSVLVAALFGLHPLRVESVAWIAERKDVLAAFWWMVALLAYGAWVRRRTAARYVAVVIAFAGGLLSKPMVVTLPFVLLLLDLWPLCRPIALRLVVEKIPLFALAAAASAVTFVAQREGGAVMSLEHLSVPERVGGAAVAYATYLAKTVWPVDLAVFYPIQPLGAAQVTVAVGALAGVSAAVLLPAVRAPAPAIGWLWFLGTLVPVIGLVKVGQQALADRFTYLPQVGLFVAGVWWLGDRLPRRAGIAVGACAVAASCLLTVRQLAVWRDSVSLFHHALAAGRDNPVAETNLAAALLELGRLDEARPHAERAVGLAPESAEAWITLGRARIQGGDATAAAVAFATAARLDPHDARAHYNLGVVAAEQGRSAEAMEHYRRAIAERPTYANAYNNLGNLLVAAERLEDAEAALREAVRLNPKAPSSLANLAIVLEHRGRAAEAIAAYEAALAEAPAEPMLWYNLAAALSGAGRRDDAVQALRHALRLRPGWEPAVAALEALGAGDN